MEKSAQMHVTIQRRNRMLVACSPRMREANEWCKKWAR
ncbi:MAG: hypothetical protein ACI9JU_002140, partial [Pseudohongiellaceae bacterium]